jgi:hypothetical protein
MKHFVYAKFSDSSSIEFSKKIAELHIMNNMKSLNKGFPIDNMYDMDMT